ncbi:MAG: type I methionyl aminopeptidase [Candidatus Nealsonbacteria bacterium]|nr:type I methionyl aminopeptidase [Candidatus Nealsonbacteria bacterium]
MVPIKSEKEIEIMAEGGEILAKVMSELAGQVRPGVKTIELDRLAESLIFSFRAECSFKGYQGYPSCLCVSVNEEIVHAIPSERELKEGDIVSLDLGVKWKGFHADMAITLPVGQISLEAEKLIKATRGALEKGVQELKPGSFLGNAEEAVQKCVESQRFNVIRDLCGHGIGRELHEEPQILNYGKRGTGLKLKEGMVLCLEPMVAMGDWHLKKSPDGFGYLTKDGSLSAHFEQTIAITKNGAKSLTVIQ